MKFAQETDGIVALSPAFNYKGIRTGEDASNIHTPVLLIVSNEDIQSVEDTKKLHGLISESTLQIYSGKGHGTRMLDKETKTFILQWLESYRL